MTTTVGLTYTLGRALHVSLTNRCNALTLVESRGPGFAISAASGFAPLQTEPTPSCWPLLRSHEFKRVFRTVLCCAGEPLLRLTCLEASSRRPRGISSLPARFDLNGLVPGSRRALHRSEGVSQCGERCHRPADAEQYQT